MSVNDKTNSLLDAALSAEPLRPEPSMDSDTQAVIGDLLRGMYADLLKKPVPDRFLEILQRMDDGSSEDQS